MLNSCQAARCTIADRARRRPLLTRGGRARPCVVPGARCGVTQCTTPSAPGRACTPTAGCSMRLPHVAALRAGPRGPLSVTQGAAGLGRAPVRERGAHVPMLPGGRLVLRQELLGQAQAQRLPGAHTPCAHHLTLSLLPCLRPCRMCGPPSCMRLMAMPAEGNCASSSTGRRAVPT